MAELAADGIRVLAPPLWMLVTLNEDSEIVPSAYALAAKDAGLGLIAWTLERSGPLADGGGWYYQSVADAIDRDGDVYELLDVLAREVGGLGIFSDWPATVPYYANCLGLDGGWWCHARAGKARSGRMCRIGCPRSGLRPLDGQP
jgi:glycerophosphoryl diester phosphodiesterase